MLDPFSGWLVDPGYADRVVIPPYDLLTLENRREILDRNPDSYLHAILDPADHPGPDRLAACRAAIDRLIAERMTVPRADSFAVYRLTVEGRSLTGLVGHIPYSKLRWTSVLGHEQVKPDRVKLLAEYLATVRASSSPAAVAVRDDQPLKEKLASLADRQPDLTVPSIDGGARQEVWIVEPDQELSALSDSFDPIYVVDGHHRIAAAVAVKEIPILGVVFPASELRIEAFHRILGPLHGVERADLRGKLGRATRLQRPTRQPRPGTIVLWFEGDTYELPTRRPELVALHDDVIPYVDATTDPRLRYLAPQGELAPTENEAVFFVPPLDVDFVFDMATSGHPLPPKSTRFYPKARSGVFLSLP